jgi:YVTN family beta-propeller protein
MTRHFLSVHRSVVAFSLSLGAVLSASAQQLTTVAPMGTLIADHGIVFNAAAHKIYAVDQAHGAVVVIDCATGASKRVATGAHPDAIAVNTVTNRVYVVNSGAGNVSVLDGKTDEILATVKTDRRPYYIAVNETTNKAYVSNTFSKVMTVIDGAANTSTDWPIGSGDAETVDEKKNQVYLLGYEDPNLRIIDGTTGEITREPVGSIHAWAPVIDAGLRKLYVTRVGTADVLVVDLESRKHSVIAVGNYPCAIAVNPKTHMAYVTNYADDTVSVIDGAKGTVAGTVKVGHSPQSAAVDAVTNRVYVGNAHSDTVSVIDAAKLRVTATLPAGKHPYAVVVDPAIGAVYAGNMPDPESTEAPVFTKVITGKSKK